MKNRGDIFNTKVGEIVKVYMTASETENSKGVCKWINGEVVEIGRRIVERHRSNGEKYKKDEGFATVKPMEEDIDFYDRYMDHWQVEFTGDFDLKKVTKSRKILSEEKD